MTYEYDLRSDRTFEGESALALSAALGITEPLEPRAFVHRSRTSVSVNVTQANGEFRVLEWWRNGAMETFADGVNQKAITTTVQLRERPAHAVMGIIPIGKEITYNVSRAEQEWRDGGYAGEAETKTLLADEMQEAGQATMERIRLVGLQLRKLGL